MAASKAFIAAVAMTALIIQSAAAATNFTVGAPGGSWDLKTNFASWAASNKFAVGDNLIFTYSPQQHNVLEVTKANYDSCSASGPISTYATGNDAIPLPAAATRYFICGFPTHCARGMKVAIAVSGAAATTPQASSPAPSTPGSSSSSSPPASSPSSSTSPSSPAGSSPAPTSPPGNSATSPTTSSAPPPPQTPNSGATDRSLQAKAALGFGILMILAL